jgi:hypothetical protein
MAVTRIQGSGILDGPFAFESGDQRFTAVFLEATLRPPTTTPRITTVVSVSLEPGNSSTMVGLTRYSPAEGPSSSPSQRITFYSPLIDELSDGAAGAVVAHELAHAWLNEHVRPEESKAREAEADSLARTWGFGPELDALDREADSV